MNHGGGQSHVTGGYTVNNPPMRSETMESNILGQMSSDQLKVDECVSCRSGSAAAASSMGL